MTDGKLRIGYVAKNETGIGRRRNEDAWSIDETINVFLVADGMGGHPAGDVASKTVAGSLPVLVKQYLAEAGGSVSPEQATECMKSAIRDADLLVRARASSSPELEGMGTTVVASLITGSTAVIAHKGDSRAYLFRVGTLRLLTRDHTVANDLVRSGGMSALEADRLPDGRALTQCVGKKRNTDAEIVHQELFPGDLLLLCSDGLTGGLADGEITEIIGSGHPDLEACCNDLVDSAIEGGSLDDITVVLAKVVVAG